MSALHERARLALLSRILDVAADALVAIDKDERILLAFRNESTRGKGTRGKGTRGKGTHIEVRIPIEPTGTS
jgi:hypothetical protein